MSLFTTTELKNRAFTEISKGGLESRFSTTSRLERITNKLFESLNAQKVHNSLRTYDIFLSHSSKDAEEVEGLKLTLEDMGYSVYVDWIDDPQADRSRVSKETALMLQTRMKQSRSLIYAFSDNGQQSKWMPWELGYFDALKSKAAILPIVASSVDESYRGVEFLGIYNYVVNTSGTLYVHETLSKYVLYSAWLTGSKP